MAGREWALDIFRGSTEPFVVELVDDVDTPENLATADRASVVWYDRIGGSAQQTCSTEAGNLVLNLATGSLTGTLTGLQADALVPGEYVGQAAVRFGSDNNWKVSRFFRVRVHELIAPKVGA